jgi:hypothetical protein
MKKAYKFDLDPPIVHDRSCSYLTGRERGHVPTLKTDGPVPYTHPDIRDCAFLLDIDPGVHRFRYKPIVVPIIVGADRREHAVAFEVVDAEDGTVEYRDVQLDHLSDEYVAAVRRHFASTGDQHRWMTPEEIRREPRWSNVDLLRRVRGAVEIPTEAKLRLLQLLMDRTARYQQVVVALSPFADADLIAKAAISFGILQIDLDGPLGPDTPVHLGRGAA